MDSMMERCPLSSLPRPRVTTLVADPSDTKFAAYVVTPACEEEHIAVNPFIRMVPSIFAVGRNIEAVVSVPSGISVLNLADNRVTSLDLRQSRITGLYLDSNHLTSIADFHFPASLTSLTLDGNPIEKVQSTDFPQGLEGLSLRNTSFTTFRGSTFPKSLVSLELIDMASLRTFEGLVLPPRVGVLYATNTATTEFAGVSLPVSLDVIELGGDAPLTRFDVRQSDVSLLSNTMLQILGGTSIEACSDPRGLIQTIQNDWQACVYSDDVFDELFSPPPTPTEAGAISSAASDADDNQLGSPSPPAISSSSSADSEAPTAERGTNSGTNSNNTSSSNNNSISTQNDNSATTPPPPSNSVASGEAATTTTTTILLTLFIAAAMALLAALFVLRRRRKRASATPTKPARHQLSSSSAPLPTVANDVRDDANFLQFKIAATDLVAQSPLAVNQSTVVYPAKLFGRDVIVKRFTMVQDQQTCDATQALQSIVDEIRLWATLDHAAIVAFVGVSWTQSELSLVTERTEHGDLRTLIHREFGGATNSPPWFNLSSRDATTAWSKATIALDVAVALVYLHSFSPPVLHGGVNCANVMISSSYRAKLGDFSASGYGEGDDIEMVYKGSQSAVVAPEVQRGERYSAKADVYGLGTVLEELASRDGVGCPMVIRELVAACLQADPLDRPGAMEVHYRLRQVIAAARRM